MFSYPLDTAQLLRKKNRIKKNLIEKDVKWLKVKLAILGGSTTSEIADQIELFLLHHGIKASIYQSEYGQFWEDAVFGNEELDTFSPDIVYIHTNWRNLRELPDVNKNIEEVTQSIDSEYEHFRTAWNSIEERYHCIVIQSNFDRPLYRLLGNRDIFDYRGWSNYIYRLNGRLYDYASAHERFYINDIDYLSAEYGLDKWSNSLYWNMYKYSLCLDAIPYLAKNVADIIKSIYGKNKKVLVCDLDNTLWGGVIGDDGIEGIQLGPEMPMGQIYSEVQKYVKNLKSIGVLLAVNSKNDEENALLGLKHPDSVLETKDFASIQANWNNKDANILAIAEELNLGTDSFVFMDDNPVERDIVAGAQLGVETPDIGEVENYIQYIDRNGFFEVSNLSEDDLRRTEMYEANRERNLLQKSVTNYDDFLHSLEMKATIRSFEPMYYQRISQLTNKSNQFNLTTLRLSESDIISMQEADNYICLYGKLSDRYGDNGLVSVVAGEIIDRSLHIRLWLMSCRVLKRTMEDAMLDELVSVAILQNIDTIYGYYYPTEKNKMVRDFYGRMGFNLVSEDSDGSSVWKMDVLKYEKRCKHIAIIQ